MHYYSSLLNITVFLSIIRSPSLYIHLMLYVQTWTPDDGRKYRPEHVEWYSINSKNSASSWFTTETEIGGGGSVRLSRMVDVPYGRGQWSIDVPYSRCQSHSLYNAVTLLPSKRFLLRLGWSFGCASLTLILRRSRMGTVWFYTSTNNKRASRPKLYTKSLTRDLKVCIIASHWWEFPLTFRHRASCI